MKKTVITCGDILRLNYRSTSGLGWHGPTADARLPGAPVFPECLDRKLTCVLPVRSTEPGGMERGTRFELAILTWKDSVLPITLPAHAPRPGFRPWTLIKERGLCVRLIGGISPSENGWWEGQVG